MAMSKLQIQQKLLNLQALALVLVLLTGVFSSISATRPSSFMMTVGLGGGLTVFVVATAIRVLMTRSERSD